MASPTSHLSARGFSGRFRAGLGVAAVAATAVLVAGCAPPSPLGQGDNPSGAVDSVYLTDGGVVVSGWASDRNSAAPVEVVFTVAGRLRPERIAASVDRPDLGALIGRSDRGYSIYLPIPGATAATAVCVSAINVGPGASSLLGCRRAVDSAPVTPPTLPPPPPPILDWLNVGETGRVSLTSDGTQSDDGSTASSISADGRYVAFDSYATNLAPGDTNGFYDIYMRDAVGGTTSLVSVSTGGVVGNSASYHPSISADGRYVAFDSNASNLVAGDTNSARDIFVRDTVAGTTTRVSVATGGVEANSTSRNADISADGRYVTFESAATNLVSGDTNGSFDTFVRDTVAGTTTRVSVATDGTEGDGNSYYPFISDDGRYVAFESDATNFFFGDINGSRDIFLHDITTATTTLVSARTGGVLGNAASYNPSISGDGRYVSFESSATDLVSADTNGASDAFVRDTVAGTTTRVSVATDGTQGNSDSYSPTISTDGRYIAFESYSTGLVSGDTNGKEDVFVRDTVAGTTTRVSVATGDVQANESSYYATISGDGRYVAFRTEATNLVPGDTNGTYDIVVHRIR